MGDLCPVLEKYFPALQEHHIIPREYGGENGPTIWLSIQAHQTIHLCVDNKQLRDEFLSGLKPKGKQKAVQLIKAIETSRAVATEKKLVTDRTIHIKIPGDVYERLKAKADSFQMTPNKLVLSLIEKIT